MVLSATEKQHPQLSYKIDYAQQGRAESGVAAFQIFDEVLTDVTNKRVLFDRRDPDASPLKSALQFIETDRGIFAAIRKARANGTPADIPALVAECSADISRFARFRLAPYALSRPGSMPELGVGQAETAPPRLGYDGEGLSSFLYYINETDHPSSAAIEGKLQLVFPDFQEFEFTTLGAQRVAFAIRFKNQRDAIQAVRLSDGILIFLGLMALLHSAAPPPVMLIEEPENGLTPTALKAFYAAVRELALHDAQKERSQILMSSHSPFVICEAWNGQDRDFIHQVKSVNGQAIVKKFSDVVAENKIALGKDESGHRTVLGLRNAEEIMSGYLS